jgi:hypothetical protein
MPTRLPKSEKSEPAKRGKLPPNRKLTVERVEAALRASLGIKQLTADALGCTRQNLWKFMEANPELKEVVKEIEESTLDLAENNIVTDIVTGKNVKTSMWYAERKGKDRGYSTRVETTGANGEPIKNTVITRRIVDPAPGDRPKEVYDGTEEDNEDDGTGG